MDEYMECLREYIMESRIGKRLRATDGYQTLLERSSDAYQTLSGRLDAAELELLEAFCAAREDLHCADSDAMFAEGVELGKWLAREIR